MEEEQSNREELQRLLTKATNEAAMWRQKCESGEGSVRAEEMDELKRKFNAKIAELEAQLEAALAKASSLEKVKNRLQGEMDDLMVEVDKVRPTRMHFLIKSALLLDCIFYHSWSIRDEYILSMPPTR